MSAQHLKKGQAVKSWPLFVRNIKENFCVIRALSIQFSDILLMIHLCLCNSFFDLRYSSLGSEPFWYLGGLS